MNSALSLMIEKYHPTNNQEKENAIKEIIQEIVLSGLSRGGFFEKVAFYGGTCLRIFYYLDRFRTPNGNPRLFNCRDENEPWSLEL